MNAETRQPNLELTPIEREILAELAKGDRTIFIVREGHAIVAVSIDKLEEGQELTLDIETMKAMCRKRWLCHRSKPDRYRLTTKGMRIIKSRL